MFFVFLHCLRLVWDFLRCGIVYDLFTTLFGILGILCNRQHRLGPRAFKVRSEDLKTLPKDLEMLLKELRPPPISLYSPVMAPYGLFQGFQKGSPRLSKAFHGPSHMLSKT